MIVYYTVMRYKDENKRDAIFRATIQLLNEVGFADISMSKIARHANVSSSTIYVYFDNKDDMLRKLYLNVKETMSRQMTRHLNESISTRDAHRWIMRDLLDFILNNKDYFLFMEQFTSSPMIDRLCLRSESALTFGSLHEFIERGKREKLFKPFDNLLLLSFCYFPIVRLAQAHFNQDSEVTEESLDEVIQMSWDAIKV
jgi:AcrR family transcriptional regulator